MAAYEGLDILQPKKGETVVVSTAAGATGLLLCHLLKKRESKIVAMSSKEKQKYLTHFTDKFIDYRDVGKMKEELQGLKFWKYFDNVG